MFPRRLQLPASGNRKLQQILKFKMLNHGVAALKMSVCDLNTIQAASFVQDKEKLQ